MWVNLGEEYPIEDGKSSGAHYGQDQSKGGEQEYPITYHEKEGGPVGMEPTEQRTTELSV